MNARIYRLILVRHGESEANISRLKEYSHIGGRAESPLSIAGAMQSDNLQKLNFMSDPKGSMVYSSPSGRAVETAMRATGITKAQIIIDSLLAERSLGDVEGLSLEQAKNNPLYACYFKNDNGYKFRHSFTNHLPSAESYTHVVQRTKNWFDKFIKEVPHDISIAKVFSHVITMRCMLHWMLKMTEQQTLSLRIDNAVPIIIDCTADGQGVLKSSPLTYL